MFRTLVLALLCWTASASASQAEEGVVDIQNPVWIQQPDGQEFVDNYPEQAFHQRIEGRATIECYVRLDTSLDCAVTSESPESWGFGDAATAIARSFRVEPARINGRPVEGGRIRRTIRFLTRQEGEFRDSLPLELRIILEAVAPPDLPSWDEAPTSAAVLLATPDEQRVAGTRGRGVLSCRVREDRRLNCEPLLETPAGSRFAAAALALAPQFRVARTSGEFIAAHADEPFLLPISFGGPPDLTPVNRFHAGIGPLNMPTLVAPPEAYPTRALAARIRGSVVVLCTVREAAPMDCVAERETPIEWGFADEVLDVVRALPEVPSTLGLMPGDQVRFSAVFIPD